MLELLETNEQIVYIEDYSVYAFYTNGEGYIRYKYLFWGEIHEDTIDIVATLPKKVIQSIVVMTVKEEIRKITFEKETFRVFRRLHEK